MTRPFSRDHISRNYLRIPVCRFLLLYSKAIIIARRWVWIDLVRKVQVPHGWDGYWMFVKLLYPFL